MSFQFRRISNVFPHFSRDGKDPYVSSFYLAQANFLKENKFLLGQNIDLNEIDDLVFDVIGNYVYVVPSLHVEPWHMEYDPLLKQIRMSPKSHTWFKYAILHELAHAVTGERHVYRMADALCQLVDYYIDKPLAKCLRSTLNDVFDGKYDSATMEEASDAYKKAIISHTGGVLARNPDGSLLAISIEPV